MKSYVKLFAPILGSLILFTVAVKFYQQNSSLASGLPYQSSAVDLLNSSTTTELVQPVEDPTAEEESESASSSVTTAPTTSPAVVAPVASLQPAVSFAAPLVIPPPLIASSVGAGGTLTNQPIVIPPTLVSLSAVVGTSSVATTSSATTTIPQIEVASSTETFICLLDATSTTPTTHLVISEVFIDMPGADTQEFVELYNPGSSTVNLASSSLQYLFGIATSTASLVKKNFLVGSSIAAHGFYLVGMGDYSASTTADMLWSQSLGNTGATVLLVSNQAAAAGFDDQDIIDRLAYGGDVPLPPAGSSLELVGGVFVVQSVPTPQNTASPVKN